MVFQGHFGQPSVENAMGIGAAARKRAACITAALAPTDWRNRLRVSDDMGMAPGAGSGGFYFVAAVRGAATRVSGIGSIRSLPSRTIFSSTTSPHSFPAISRLNVALSAKRLPVDSGDGISDL